MLTHSPSLNVQIYLPPDVIWSQHTQTVCSPHFRRLVYIGLKDATFFAGPVTQGWIRSVDSRDASTWFSVTSTTRFPGVRKLLPRKAWHDVILSAAPVSVDRHITTPLCVTLLGHRPSDYVFKCQCRPTAAQGRAVLIIALLGFSSERHFHSRTK